MSEAFTQTQENPKAEAVQLAAAEWLEHRERGDWKDADGEAFDLWLAACPAHAVAYLRAEDAWFRADRLRALNHPERISAGSSRHWKFFATTAAVFAAVLVLTAGGIAYIHIPHDTLYTTEIGQRENLQLVDGSQVELNTDTALRIGTEGEARVATLEKGEAYFDIRHDAKHSFIVRIGDDRVVDLGTKFLIRRADDHVRVAVFEGRTRFDLPGPDSLPHSAVLTPGEVAVAKAGTMNVMKASPVALNDDIAWRRGELVFHFTSLADAAAEFNRYNQRKIAVQGSEIGRMQIGGTFGMHDVAGFGRQVSRLLGVRADDRGMQIVLSR